MDLEYIEDLINRENINLIDTYLEDTAGAYINYNKINVILYDSHQLETSIEKKQIFAEELGHYYNIYENIDTIKLNVSSVSLIIKNKAVFLSPKVSSSISS